MTTAHRPTFDPARGKEAARGEAYHQRLLPAHKTLKYRQAGQGGATEQAKRDLRADLLRKERKHQARKEGRDIEDDETEDEERLAIEDRTPSGVKRKLSDTHDDADVDGVGDDARGRSSLDGDPDEDYETKKRRVLEATHDIDADSESRSSSSSEESEDDEEDEQAELMRELAKIKAERAEKAAQEAAAQAKRDEEQREKDIALGNPLLNDKKDYGIKRRWDDDVVFKNQARGTEERGKEKRLAEAQVLLEEAQSYGAEIQACLRTIEQNGMKYDSEMATKLRNAVRSEGSALRAHSLVLEEILLEL